MRRARSIPSSAVLIALVLSAAVIGCPTQPVRPAGRDTAAPAPDVRKHVLGVWWRAHRGRVEGLQLGVDSRLALSGVPYVRGVGWHVDGRKLFLGVRDEVSALDYDDELYIRRLTDRTLIVEAGDSYFSGTYHRSRDAAAAELGVGVGAKPLAAERAAIRADNDGTRPAEFGAPAGSTAIDPLVLRAVDAEAVPPRAAWLTPLAELAQCAQQLNRSLCPRFYADEPASLLAIEVCQPDPNWGAGLHFVDARGERSSYPWFDEGFGRFACEYGCQGSGCRYEVAALAADGRPAEVVYRFEVGATWGWVRLQLGADGTVRVIGRELRSPQ